MGGSAAARAITCRLRRLWDWITGPSAGIEAPELRRRARMLAGLLVFLIVSSAVLTLLLPWILVPAEHAANRVLNLTGLGVIAVGLGIYAVSRTRHFEAAAWLSVFATFASVTFSLYASQGTVWQDGGPFFLALAVILATVLLPLTAALIVVAMTLVAPVVFYHTVATFTAVGLSNAMTFLAVTSALLMVTGLVRHFDLAQIHFQTRALAESEERYRTLFEASFEGLVLHESGRVVEVNRAMARLWGMSRRKLVGRRLDDLVTVESRDQLVRRAEGRPNATHEAVAVRDDGGFFDVEFITKPYVFRGRLVQVTGFRDVTARKEAEAARLKARELESANGRLVEVDQLKTRILNVTSHELNTPITPLRMQVHLLKNAGFGELNEKQRQSVAILERNLGRLSTLVKDILDVSRLEAGRFRLDPQPVEVTDLVRSIAVAFRSAANERSVRLHLCTTIEDWVEADPKRLRQAIVNLLSNALESTPPGGRVTIETQGCYDHLDVEVRDSGIGMDARQQARLFRPFDPVHDRPSGSGLGLYITRGIVERHGGQVEVHSEGPGKGCRVRVRIPKRWKGVKGAPLGDARVDEGPRDGADPDDGGDTGVALPKAVAPPPGPGGAPARARESSPPGPGR